MAKTDWQMDDVVQPSDLNQIGQEINDLQEAVENIDIPDATLTTKGKVQLSSATNSSAENRAATPKAVKDAMDTAAAALPASSYTAADILAKLKTVDGAGSGLDADLLDGVHLANLAQTRAADATLLNNAVTTPSGMYTIADGPAIGLPANWFHIIHLRHHSVDGYAAQIAVGYSFAPGVSPGMYTRTAYGTTWGPWRKLWDDSSLRINNGQLEFLDGGVWRSVSNNGISVASDTVQVFDPTERNNNGARGTLIHKFLPKVSGELVISADIRSNNTTWTTYLRVASARRRISGNVEHVIGEGRNNLDWKTPLGTFLSGSSENSETSVFILSTMSTSYVNLITTITVTEYVPVYFLINCDASAVFPAVRNFKICYDIVRV